MKLLTCYLLGSISFPALYAKLKGFDLRKKGYGHLGASSLFKATGKKRLFIALGLLDALKGFIAYKLAGVGGAFLAMLGHMFPIFFGFSGGNAVSVYYGALFSRNYKLVLPGVLEIIAYYKLRNKKLKQPVYLLVRAIPAVLWHEAIPLYLLLFTRHLYLLASLVS